VSGRVAEESGRNAEESGRASCHAQGKAQEMSTARGETSRHTGAPQVPETTVLENFHTRQAAKQANQFHTRQGREHADLFHTRTLPLDFPHEDPEGWCYRASQFFEYYVIPDQQRFTIASFHMEGRALVWFQELRSGNGLTTWNEFLKALQARFGTGSYDDPMETLVKLK
jgi:hypothetical protein